MNLSILPLTLMLVAKLVIWPVVPNKLIAQQLGTRNFGGYHTGIDILVPLHTPVFAICDGKVVVNNTGSYPTAFANYWNSFVIIEHRCGKDTIFGYYGHVTSNISVRSEVKSGQVLGYVVMAKSITDKTTQAGIDRPTNIHLHFGLNKRFVTNQLGYEPSMAAVIDAGWINPITYLNKDD